MALIKNKMPTPNCRLSIHLKSRGNSHCAKNKKENNNKPKPTIAVGKAPGWLTAFPLFKEGMTNSGLLMPNKTHLKCKTLRAAKIIAMITCSTATYLTASCSFLVSKSSLIST